MKFFHCPVKITERTVAYYMGDWLYWVATIAIWVISHFPLIEHPSRMIMSCTLSVNSWRFMCCRRTGISKLLIMLQLSILKFCHPRFHSSIPSYRFSMSLVVLRYAGILDFSQRLWFDVSWCNGRDMFDKYFVHSLHADYLRRIW